MEEKDLSLDDNVTYTWKERVESYVYTSGFGLVIMGASAVLTVGLIVGAVMLFGGK